MQKQTLLSFAIIFICCAGAQGTRRGSSAPSPAAQAPAPQVQAPSPPVQTPAPSDPLACSAARKSESQSDMFNKVLGQYYSIGYLSLDMVAQLTEPAPASCGMRFSNMQNKVGNVVSANVNSIRSAVLLGPSTCPGFGLCADIVDTSAPTGWPISFLSYLVVSSNVTDSCPTSTTFSPACSKCLAQKTVYDYIKWILNSPSAASVLGARSFATLPSFVVNRIAGEILPNIACAGVDGVYTRAANWPADTQAVKLVSGGASVQAAAQVALANAFNIETSVSISFVGAKGRTPQLAEGTIDFEFRDVPFDPASLPPANASRLRMIPVMAAAVVPVYNLEKYQPLVLSRAALSGLFLGTVPSWADPTLTALNPAASLAPQAPVRFVSGDDSGGTGVPAVFLAAIRSFAGLAANAGPSPLLPPSQQQWPAQPAPPPTGVTCGNKACSQLVCSPGSYYSAALNECALCAAGTYTVSPGSLACRPCPPGTYSSLAGSKSCFRCGDTGYQPDSGSTACLSCPDNTRRYGVLPHAGEPEAHTTPDAAAANASDAYVYGSQRAECLCLAGFWLPASVNHSSVGGQACEACPEGAVCAGFADGEQRAPTTKVNYWGDPAHPSAFFECDVDRCLEDYHCAPGRAGRLCHYPEEGHYLVAGMVRECSDGIQAPLALLTALEVLLWIMCVNFACSQYHSLAVDMIMLQTSGYIAKLKLRWHPRLEVIGVVAAFFNFEISYVGHQCSDPTTWTDVNLFYWQLAFPFLAVALCACWWLVKAGYRRLLDTDYIRARIEARERKLKRVRVIKNKSTLASVFHTPHNFYDYIWIKFLMFILTSYPVLVYTAFSIFPCQSDASGVSYLVNMPGLVCWSPDHWNMIFFTCAYIPVVILAVPLILGRRLYWGLKADLLNRCSFMECYGWIYARYKCDYAWWEMIVLIRRALIALCAALATVPMVSASAIIFILNVFVCAQLFCLPQMQRRIRLLEVGSLFCCLIQAVAGVLLCPSLDMSSECVGSTYLDKIGSICDSNTAYKSGVTIIVLIIFSCNLFTSLALFALHLRRNWTVQSAIKRIHSEYDIPYDRYDIHLSNIVDGRRLDSLLRDPSLRDSDEVRDVFRRLNVSLPGFIMFNHAKSGHYAQDEYARTLGRLLANFPGLLDWIAQADRAHVKRFAAFVEDYAAYAREHHDVAFGEIILADYRPSVLVWLATCDGRHRESLCKLLLGMATASGVTYFLRPGRIRDILLQEANGYMPVWTEKEGDLKGDADPGRELSVLAAVAAEAEARVQGDSDDCSDPSTVTVTEADPAELFDGGDELRRPLCGSSAGGARP